MIATQERPARGLLRRAEPAGTAGRGWPLRRIFVVGSVVTALLAAASITLGAVGLDQLVDERAVLVDRVAPAQQASQELSTALLNQETGIRGYDLSARGEFLGPFRAGLIAERDAVATLERLGAADGLGRMSADLARVERAAGVWRTQYAELVVAGGGAQAGVPSADPLLGRVLFEDVRAAEDTLLANLIAEQDAARQRVNEATTFLLVVGVAIAVVLLAFLVVAGLGLSRGVLQPVSQLAARTRGVVSDDVTQEVRGSGPREIVELGEDVEAMRAHIVRELAAVQGINRRLDEQAGELARSNRDLEQFAYVASHDLQEPLRKVSSFCQLLQRRYGGQLDERADQYIGFAVDGAQRMQRLINDLLAFSRVGRTTVGFGPVALGDVATAAAAELETARAEAGGQIVVGELPEVHGDRALLHQLLVNLVGNGLKFGREGVPPVVTVSARPDATAPREAGRWEIRVADNGIGIDPEFADKVFVIFQRLHAREVYTGTGIGLALVKKIVEFHRGEVWLDNEPAGPDGGATVRFTLPATVAFEETS